MLVYVDGVCIVNTNQNVIKVLTQHFSYLAGKLRILPSPFHTDNVGLQLAGHTHHPVEGSCDLQGIADGETSQPWIDSAKVFGVVALKSSKQCSKEDDEITKKFQPNGQPPRYMAQKNKTRNNLVISGCAQEGTLASIHTERSNDFTILYMYIPERT